MRGEGYQKTLIALGVLLALLLGAFYYRELFPEYKTYQNAYVALEALRSEQTGVPPPLFESGIKQIVLEEPERGPPKIDRCTSCHVALEFPHFSPTSKEYVWNLVSNDSPLRETTFGGHTVSVEKALQMHPLIGEETRPFEFHPIEEYGCVSCHSGNGQAIGFEKSHGPVWDRMYEEADMGETPSFLEKDPENDPPFSRVFNHKPGHKLLFQTTPIFVGGLIEAKCMQCHTEEREDSSDSTGFYHFKMGKENFISQGCYACHRIQGTARGGVGPDLSNAGETYPWFLKESIVWPQADLATSTMPNMHLDHDEIENLMTYLLAQKEKGSAQLPFDEKVKVLEWEGGKKLAAFEKRVDAKEAYDLSYGMRVFAEEGCASCHRLLGYESSVGFAIEKDTPSFAGLLSERDWFEETIHEQIAPLELVSQLEKYGKELDLRIVEGVRSPGILEEIEQRQPGLIESFYPSFTFAGRAKNHAFAGDSESLTLWKKRVRRVLMQFVQQYGLGRQIGPKTSWSGIYRTDRWLMEHFWNPSSRAARSIMPAFPFDETKFYALTNMLNELSVRNRDEVRKRWNTLGFDPKKAFQIHCAQCHGEQLLGNGPVAKWIYPIPKNLRNADFLRNYTRENVKHSLIYGVKGGPMPPWGEVAEEKPGIEGVPMLMEEEIDLLIEWLFAPLIGEEVLGEEGATPKWEYGPQDVLKEIKEEGGALRLTQIEELFTRVQNPENPFGKDHYHIRKEFYTKENVAAGKKLFEVHCASCHGREGDGLGERALTMVRARPRMLTNYDWQKTRDDLRMIRSIKYGVLGTSMTPWGDQTNSFQRIQLVMYIRSLLTQVDLRRTLSDALYKAFDQFDPLIELEGNFVRKQAVQEHKALFARFGASLISVEKDSLEIFIEMLHTLSQRFTTTAPIRFRWEEEEKMRFTRQSERLKEQIEEGLVLTQKRLVLAEDKISTPEILEEIDVLEGRARALQGLIDQLGEVSVQGNKLRDKEQL